MAQQQMIAPSSYPAPPAGGDDASALDLATYIHQAMVAIEEQQDRLGFVPAGMAATVPVFPVRFRFFPVPV